MANNLNTENPKSKKIESLVDYLKEDLKQLEELLRNKNAEVMDFIELKNTLETMKEHFNEGFTSMVNVGANIFMETRIEETEKILVNIGNDIYLQFTLDEAIFFSKSKINFINKEIALIRESTIKKRADINISLICIGENLKFE